MEKRDRIIQTARERFHYYGVQKTTMQEIAKDAGMAVGSLYLHFKNKDDLIAACTEEFVKHHRETVTEILESSISASEKIRTYILRRFRVAEEKRTGPRHAAELAREVLRVKPDRLREEAMMMWETVVRILKEGIAKKEFAIAEPEHDAKIFLYSVAYFFPNALMEMKDWPTEDALGEVLDWFLATWQRGTRSNK